VRVRWPRLRPGHEELVRYVEFGHRMVDRGEPFVVVTDLRDGATLEPGERTWLIEQLRSVEERAGSLYRGSAVVTGNILMLALLRVAHLVTPPPYPLRVFRKMSDAEAWLEELLPFRDHHPAAPPEQPTGL